ncbi:MAG: hypothetical protein ACR2OW_06545, partial [Methyloligellaceae bacterium]
AVYKYVLQNFSKADQDWLPDAIETMAKASVHLADDRADKFMNEVARVLGNSDDKKQTKPKPSGSPDSKTRKKFTGGGDKTRENKVSPARSGEKKKPEEESQSGPLAEKLRALFSRNSDKNQGPE